MSSGQINPEAVQEQYPILSIGSFLFETGAPEQVIKMIKKELK
jgi:hypothetical protein